MKHFLVGCMAILASSHLWAVPAAGGIQADVVVRLNATIPTKARTSQSLGTEREDNGIVIDRQGLILTIGYGFADVFGVSAHLEGHDRFVDQLAGVRTADPRVDHRAILIMEI